RLNHLGLVLSPTSKIRLLDECKEMNDFSLLENIKRNPLVKITGDNLDVYVRSCLQGLGKQHMDMHLFASNLLSSRIVTTDMDNTMPTNIDLDPTSFLLQGYNADILRMSYKLLLSKIVSPRCVSFKWMESVTPTHMPHPYQAEMSEKSLVFQLPIQMRNEAKYEDCIEIMNNYEEIITKLFKDAHGNNL
ncbi:hypothetical protein FSP39_000234, partial [Pinctada imbricata]